MGNYPEQSGKKDKIGRREKNQKSGGKLYKTKCQLCPFQVLSGNQKIFEKSQEGTEFPVKFIVLREREFTRRSRNVTIHNAQPAVTQKRSHMVLG